MKTNNKIYKFIFLFSIIFISSCETVDLNLIEDPSRLNESFIDPDYTFNYVQLQLPEFVDSSNGFTQRVTRQMAMTGGNTYDNAFAPVNFNGNWSTAYRMLNAIKIMEPQGIETKNFYALGASKLIRCYVLMTLVDMYGDIPYTEILQGNNNLTPRYDNSAFVYKKILQEIDEAVVILKRTDGTTSKNLLDLYYSNQKSWITLANTLKLKMYLSARVAGSEIGIADIGSAINAIVIDNNIIDTPAEDFEFRYGSTRNDPNSRHPLYNDQYELGGGAYVSNYIMWAMTEEKKDPFQPNIDIVDPRTDYYFCKQDDNPAGESEFVLPLGVRPAHYNNEKYDSFYVGSTRAPYKVSNWLGETSIVSNGYWGRDHGDNSGIPPDNDKRTCAGLYPIGGKYNGSAVSKSVQNSGTDGALGDGIMPIILSSYVHFMLTEASLTCPTFTALTARSEFIKGVGESVDKTIKFGGIYPNLSVAESLLQTTQIAEHQTFLLKIYDSANPENKLELVEKEFFIASWGNGIEPYNAYRRTGYPSNFQPTLEPVSGDFYNCALYPASAVNNNPNTPANLRTRKVFWHKSNVVLH